MTGLRSIRPSIGTEDFIPEEMDHREIAVRVPVMNEVQFLFVSEPCKPLKPRSLYVVFLVEKNVRFELTDPKPEGFYVPLIGFPDNPNLNLICIDSAGQKMTQPWSVAPFTI